VFDDLRRIPVTLVRHLADGPSGWVSIPRSSASAATLTTLTVPLGEFRRPSFAGAAQLDASTSTRDWPSSPRVYGKHSRTSSIMQATTVPAAAPTFGAGPTLKPSPIVTLLRRCERRNDPALIEHILTALRTPGVTSARPDPRDWTAPRFLDCGFRGFYAASCEFM
jgi:hypothetical protein